MPSSYRSAGRCRLDQSVHPGLCRRFCLKVCAEHLELTFCAGRSSKADFPVCKGDRLAFGGIRGALSACFQFRIKDALEILFLDASDFCLFICIKRQAAPRSVIAVAELQVTGFRLGCSINGSCCVNGKFSDLGIEAKLLELAGGFLQFIVSVTCTRGPRFIGVPYLGNADGSISGELSAKGAHCKYFAP